MNEQAKLLVPDEGRRKPSEFPQRQIPTNPMEMLALAVSQGADLQKLEKLMQLEREWKADRAREAFVEAMARFKAEPAKILKTKFVNVPGGAKFHHATLADVVDGVVANLAKHDLSHRWVVDQQGDAITVTTVLTHKLGHSEKCVYSGPPDKGPGRNTIQAIGSTTTYFQRYGLMAICGLAAKDMDDDGKGADAPQKPEPPAGYDNWSMDMDAKAEEGKASHHKAWADSPPDFRNYATRYDADWWARSKNKAVKAGA